MVVSVVLSLIDVGVEGLEDVDDDDEDESDDEVDVGREVVWSVDVTTTGLEAIEPPANKASSG